MSSEDTIQREFYAPWPDLGVKLSQQWEKIRSDTAALFPIVRGVGLDAAGNFDTLNGVEKCAMQALEIGKQDFHNKYRIHYNKTNDLFELAYNNGTSEVPNWYTTWWIDSDGQVTQQNTPTTASNVGGGKEVFKQKSGVDLEFRTLTASGVLTATQNTNTIAFTSSAEANTASTLGGDVGLTSTKVGVDLPFKGLTAGSSTVLTDNGDHIRIDSTAQVVEFYGISVGPSSGTPSYIEVHNLLFNREDFYITQQTTNPSNKTVIINSISDPFNSTDYVAVIGDNMTGQLAMHDGTAGEPAIGFTNETDTGIRRRAANDMALVVSGSDKLRLQDSLILASVPFQVTTTGSASGPDFAFFPDTDTGIFQNASGDGSLAFATNGVRAGYFGSNQHLYLDSKLEARSIESGYGVFYTSLISDKFLARRNGTASLPAFSWEADPNTGLFRSTTDTIAVSTGGTARSTISTTNITNTIPIYQPDGAVATPSYSFSGQTNSGIYKANDTAALHSVDIAVNAVLAASFRWTTGDAMKIRTLGAILSPDGDLAIPSYSFANQTNSGIFKANDTASLHSVDIAVNGVQAGSFQWTTGDVMQFVVPNLITAAEVSVNDEVYGSGWNADLSVPTKNAVYDKIESLSATVGGFYGTTVKHHDDSFVQRGVNVIGVNATHFYLSGNGDEVTINSRDVWVDKSGDTMTGNLTIATGGSDSIFEFFDSGSLAYTMGWDDSASAFKLADGAFDGTNDRIIVNPTTVYVKDHLSVDKIEGGYAKFYSHVEMGNPGNESSGFLIDGVGRHGVLRVNDMEFPEHEFMIHLHRHSTTNPAVIIASQSNTDTYAHAAPDPGDTIFSLVATAWGATTYEGSSRINFLVDTNGGTPGDNNMPGRIDFRTMAPGQTGLFGTLAMSIRSDQTIEAASHFYVAGDVIADRVYADQGNFYTRLTLNDRPLKFASDGILYAWDPVRLKYLSVSRHTFQYGREMGGGASAFLIGPAGTIVDGSTGTSHGLIRNATITSIDAWATTVAVAPMDLDIRQMLQGGGATHSSIHVITLETGTRVYTGEDGLDFDVDAGKGIYVVMAPSGGSTLSDPVVHVEIAWRLD